MREEIWALLHIKSTFYPKNMSLFVPLVGPILGVLPIKISILPQKLVNICAIRAGANLRVLAFKIRLLGEELGIICASRSQVN